MGATYMGSRNVTKSGIPCQPWALDTPHKIDKDIKDDQFPDETRAQAQNFCRNPQPLNKSTVWCYTKDPKVEWQYCDVCPNNFKNYSGIMSRVFNRLNIRIKSSVCHSFLTYFVTFTLFECIFYTALTGLA